MKTRFIFLAILTTLSVNGQDSVRLDYINIGDEKYYNEEYK